VLLARRGVDDLPRAGHDDVTSLPRTSGPLVSSASAVSRHDIWITIGFGGQLAFPASGNGGSLLHWNGRRWQSVVLPAAIADGGDPTSVVAVSDHDVWVGGGAPDRAPGAQASPHGTVWAAGFAGEAAILAAHGPG
jgi:hypothetical protein